MPKLKIEYEIVGEGEKVIAHFVDSGGDRIAQAIVFDENNQMIVDENTIIPVEAARKAALDLAKRDGEHTVDVSEEYLLLLNSNSNVSVSFTFKEEN